MLYTQSKYRDRTDGFSIIELLAVIAVIIIMMSMLLPALGGFGSTSARKGAVTMLMNTFEQARVAALETGQTVYVAFADADDHPSEDAAFAAFIVFREATDEERAATPSADYLLLKRWTRLPKNISFRRVANSVIPADGSGTVFTNLPLPGGKNSATFPSIAFTGSGAIEGGGSVPPLFLYEGYFANGQDNYTRDANELFERISFSRYTGRAQLDITATGD